MTTRDYNDHNDYKRNYNDYKRAYNDYKRDQNGLLGY